MIGVDADAAVDASPPIQSAELRAADKKTYEELVATLSRNIIDFLKEHDFGNAWSDGVTRPLYMYVATRNAVEHQFHDNVVEEKRKRLHAATAAFTESLAGNSIPTGHGTFELNDKAWVRSHPPGDEFYRRFEANRQELGELADAVVEAYDELVRSARRRVP